MCPGNLQKFIDSSITVVPVTMGLDVLQEWGTNANSSL